jgi:hypothetical protein
VVKATIRSQCVREPICFICLERDERSFNLISVTGEFYIKSSLPRKLMDPKQCSRCVCARARERETILERAMCATC